jgi:hypothetical protein
VPQHLAFFPAFGTTGQVSKESVVAQLNSPPIQGTETMSSKEPKTAVVAFKVEKELADLLDKLPNKSAFIRKAIAAQLGMACPLCNGKGIVPRGVHDHYVKLLEEFKLSHCDGCGNELDLPREPDDGLTREDRHRLEQFFHGGPLYCDGCYDKAPTCDDCGWHIAPENVAEHQRQVHHD